MKRQLSAVEDLLTRVIRSFRRARFEFAFTGAIAVSHYAKARATADIDIAVHARARDVARLLQAFRAAHLVVDEQQVRTAIQAGYPILSLHDARTPFGVDIILKRTPVKARAGRLLQHRVRFEAPEEIIRAKLRLLCVTRDPLRAEQDKEDVRQLLKHAAVDLASLRRMISKDSTVDLFDELEASTT